MGGIFGVLIAAVIPMICVLKLISLKSQDWLIIIFMIAMSFLCFIGAIKSITNPS